MIRLIAPSLRRTLAIAAAALLAGATLAPVDADARAGRGGSFGSRGSKTFSAPPPTTTAPSAAPMQRSATQPGQSAPSSGMAAGQQRRPGLFGGGLGAGLMGGLLGAGIFGMLAGGGFFGGLGSLASVFGLLIQVALIGLLAYLVLNWWRRRNQPQVAGAAAGAGPSRANYGMAGGAPAPAQTQRSSFGFGSGSGSGFGTPAPLQLAKDDFDAFERLLSEVQDAWSKQELGKLRTLATPEMVEIFNDDLAEDASRGVVNKATGVKLLQGDLAEAWRENGRDYASVAMRYQLTDVTEDLSTGAVVDGDPATPIEATELWTFVRASGGRWLLSAIQQTA